MRRANNINPAILGWAREAAGFDLEEAAGRLGFITEKEANAAARRLLELETGARYPTRKQLAQFAALYRRPLLTFYMNKPPLKGDCGEDFRQTASRVSRRDNSLLDALLRNMRARQEMVRSLLEDDEDNCELPFVGAATADQAAKKVADSIAATLGFDYRNRQSRRGNAVTLFKALRERAESSGVFVLLAGDLGSYHTALDPEVFRGFAISDRVAPFVVVNDRDSPAARSFTLLHELAHIWLDTSGVSGEPSPESPTTPHDRIERFCNDIAGEFLLPAAALQGREQKAIAESKEDAAEFISALSHEWSIGESMAAYRLNRSGFLEPRIYRELVADYARRWRNHRKRRREQNRVDGGGPDRHVVIRSRLGNALLGVVWRNLRDNTLTHTKAARLLGVKAGAVERLLRGYELNRGPMIQSVG